MTGSGMGCPDWPKCFGTWIPPTSISDLPNNYKEIYAHRGYDEIDFNVFNTWAEYINRLFGAIGGLFCCLLFFVSILTRSSILIFLSLFLVLLMGFQAWMGALVVYSILSPFKITIHMLIALFILCILLFVYRVSSLNNIQTRINSNTGILFALLISFIQIIFGTQVRESIDILLHTFQRASIIDELPIVFEFHRTIAWFILLSNGLLLWLYKSSFNIQIELKIILLSVSFLIISGLIMTYHSLIGFAQLIHLLSAISLFISQWSLFLKGFHFSKLKIP